MASCKLDGVNHLFQLAPAQWPMANGVQQPTFSPEALKLLYGWVAMETKPPGTPLPVTVKRPTPLPLPKPVARPRCAASAGRSAAAQVLGFMPIITRLPRRGWPVPHAASAPSGFWVYRPHGFSASAPAPLVVG